MLTFLHQDILPDKSGELAGGIIYGLKIIHPAEALLRPD